MEPEPVVKKRRGRPPGSLNKSTIEKRRAAEAPALALDVDFSSEEVLGAESASDVTEGSRGAPTHAGDARAAKTPKPPLEESRPPPPKGKPKPKPKPRKPPPPSPNESPPPTPKPRRGRAERVPEPLNPPTYLEVLQRGLKEARAKQYAEKVAQYDKGCLTSTCSRHWSDVGVNEWRSTSRSRTISNTMPQFGVRSSARICVRSAHVYRDCSRRPGLLRSS